MSAGKSQEGAENGRYFGKQIGRFDFIRGRDARAVAVKRGRGKRTGSLGERMQAGGCTAPLGLPGGYQRGNAADGGQGRKGTPYCTLWG